MSFFEFMNNMMNARDEWLRRSTVNDTSSIYTC